MALHEILTMGVKIRTAVISVYQAITSKYPLFQFRSLSIFTIYLKKKKKRLDLDLD